MLHITLPDSLEMNLWANASICSDAMKTLFPKSLKKSAKADLLRGLLCVPPHRPLWRHWCYPEGWTRAPRRPPAAAAAEMWVAAHCGQRRCAPSSTLHRTAVKRRQSADSRGPTLRDLALGAHHHRLLFNLKTYRKTARDFAHSVLGGTLVTAGLRITQSFKNTRS